jgi:hypothetical protein
VTFVGLFLSSIGSRDYTDSFIFGLLVGVLCCLTYESAASYKAKNHEYLQRVAGIINRYIEKNHRAPQGIEEGLDALREMLPHRDDADGNSLTYITNR